MVALSSSGLLRRTDDGCARLATRLLRGDFALASRFLLSGCRPLLAGRFARDFLFACCHGCFKLLGMKDRPHSSRLMQKSVHAFRIWSQRKAWFSLAPEINELVLIDFAEPSVTRNNRVLQRVLHRPASICP